MDPSDVVLLALRLWLGAVMVAHGVNHGRNLDGTASWFAAKGFRHRRVNATASEFGEVAIGIGLILGILTSIAAAGLIATMTVAFGGVHRFTGFFVFARPDEGYEWVATLAVTATALAIFGPGAISLDSAVGLSSQLSGWTGAVIALGGLLLGGVQLAAFWRRPVAEDQTRHPTKESVS
jgi:putative oxidoreductase